MRCRSLLLLILTAASIAANPRYERSVGAPADSESAGEPAPWTAAEKEMSARKALSAARKALEDGHDGEALRLYELVLVKEPHSSERRAEALYGSGIIHASPDPAVRDLARARKRLQEFRQAYPRHERRIEATGVLDLIGDLDSARAESAGVRDIASAQDVACIGEKDQLVTRISAMVADAEELRTENQAQRAEIEKLRSELQALRAEIEKRDEALRKVKDALVGRRTKR